MQSTSNKDNFGFANQGINYDKFRPQYPSIFFENLTKIIKSKNITQNFIDIATGTGFIYFKLLENFQNLCVANDISESQLKVTSEKLQQLLIKKKESNQIIPNCQILKCDAYEILSELKKDQQLQNFNKFDIITVGQAIHWFEDSDSPGQLNKFLSFAANELLQKNGILSVMGYFCQGFEYNFQENSADNEFCVNKSQTLWNEFYYNTIEKYFECDRKQLEAEYQNYNFQKYFSNIERTDFQEKVEMSIENFLAYLKTMSGYNQYVDKFSKNQDFIDPLKKLNEGIQQDLNQFYLSKNSKQLKKEKEIIFKNKYFMLNMNNL